MSIIQSMHMHKMAAYTTYKNNTSAVQIMDFTNNACVYWHCNFRTKGIKMDRKIRITTGTLTPIQLLQLAMTMTPVMMTLV